MIGQIYIIYTLIILTRVAWQPLLSKGDVDLSLTIIRVPRMTHMGPACLRSRKIPVPMKVYCEDGALVPLRPPSLSIVYLYAWVYKSPLCIHEYMNRKKLTH